MRDESSPFFDGALQGIGAGLAGALTGFSIYAFRHAGHPGLGDAALRLTMEVVSFDMALTSLICGFVGLARKRLGRFGSIGLVMTLAGPPAYVMAMTHFAQYRIPFVDHFIGGLLITFAFLVKRFAPSAPMWRVFISVLIAAVPVALLVTLIAPLLRASLQDYVSEPAIFGALAGGVFGPICGVWISLAVFMAEPVEPTTSSARFSPQTKEPCAAADSNSPPANR